MNTENQPTLQSTLDRMIRMKMDAGLRRPMAEFVAKTQLNEDARSAGNPEPFPNVKEQPWGDVSVPRESLGS